MEKEYKISSKGHDNRINKRKLEEVFLDNPMRLSDPGHILPILLYWGKLRKLIDFMSYEGKVFSERQLERLRSNLYFTLLSVPLYDFVGSPYSISYSEDEFYDNGVNVKYETLVGEIDVKHNSFHLTMGRSYDYPQCCVDAFINGSHDTRFLTKLQSEDPEKMKLANYFLHVPCKLECQESWDMAQNYQSFVRETFPRLASRIELFPNL